MALIAVTLLMLSPILLLISVSLRPAADGNAHPLGLPTRIDLANYTAAFRDMNYLRVVGNSVLISGGATVLILLCGSLAAWAISRHVRRWSNAVYRAFVAGLAIPVFVLLTPLYQVMQHAHLLDSFLSVILAYTALGLPFAVFFFTSFLKNVPAELEEAASIDGAGVVRTYWHVVLPMLRPVTATVAIFTSLNIWNDLVVPLIFLTSDNKRTVTLSVYSTIGTHSYQAAQLLPAVALGTLPLFVCFLVLQRHITAGISTGALK